MTEKFVIENNPLFSIVETVRIVKDMLRGPSGRRLVAEVERRGALEVPFAYDFCVDDAGLMRNDFFWQTLAAAVKETGNSTYPDFDFKIRSISQAPNGDRWLNVIITHKPGIAAPATFH